MGNSKPGIFSAFATTIAEWCGRPVAFVAAVSLVVVWAISGPFFGCSENWQLVINTGTTIITFLMVFILQNSQNRDGKALQAKLDELILTSQAENRFVGVEKLDEKELRKMSEMLARKADSLIAEAETVEEAAAVQESLDGPEVTNTKTSFVLQTIQNNPTGITPAEIKEAGRSVGFDGSSNFPYTTLAKLRAGKKVKEERGKYFPMQ